MLEEDGYDLFFSRDERKTRAPALPPSYHILNGVTFVSPADGNFGGSWMAVNEAGMTLALLNLYGPGIPPERAGMTSRGLLLVSLMDVQQVSDLPTRIRKAGLDVANPFTLLAFDPKRKPMRYTWDGRDLALTELTDADMPVTTSSVATARVAKRRRKELGEVAEEDGTLTVDLLESFHHSRGSSPSEFSVCMDRSDAHTVSLSHVHVTAEQVVFSYQRVVADQGKFLSPVRVELARAVTDLPAHIRSSSPM